MTSGTASRETTSAFGFLRDNRLYTGPVIGATLGHYRILSKVGEGGMGEVYRATDTKLRRDVALKVLPPSMSSDADRLSRFQREATTIAALNHPNIVTLFSVEEADGVHFLTMELVEGKTLDALLPAGGFQLERLFELAVPIADAVTSAHARGIVHRDLKPANVMVTDDGARVKVLDFGLAKLAEAGSASLMDQATQTGTEAGMILGTPYCMSPEQARGQPVDHRSDIFSLGVMLFQMATGTRPFQGASAIELLSAVLKDPAPSLGDLRPELPRHLGRIVERCLEKAPIDRYQTSRDVYNELRGLWKETAPGPATGLSSRPATQDGTVTPWAAWRAWVRRHPWVTSAALGLGVAALLVGVNVGGVRERLGGSPPAADPIKLVVLPFENLTGDPEQEYFSDGLTEEMISQLGRMHPQRLSVIARTSSMQYKKRDVPIDQIGRDLGVDYVLEGSARREGSRVRINATLIQVRDQTQLWTDTFDRELAGILALQSDVARSVAGSLRLTLLPDEQMRLASARPVNPEAYEAYLKGRFQAQKETPQDLDLALEYFEVALQKDPNYAPAYTGIAFVWAARNQMGYVPPSEATPQVKTAAMRAIELDSTLALAHYALGMVAWNEWDWETNEKEFRRAIELDSNFPDVRAVYSHLLVALKRPEEAVSQAERAVQLDPLNAFNQALYGWILYFVRRYDEAGAQFQSALIATPGSAIVHCGLWHTYSMTARPEQALKAAENCIGHYSPDVKNVLARGYAGAGYSGAMRRVGDLLSTGVRGGYVSPVDVFIPYVQAGQKDLALEWLAKSVDVRDPNLYGAVRDPFVVDSLREDPRFQEILRRARLPS